LPKQVVEPEQMIEQVQVSAPPVLEKNNNPKNNICIIYK